jgi:hypothetical protein
MVEHRIRDPQVVDILETEVGRGRSLRGGRCLICGEWIEPDAVDVYEVSVGRAGNVELDLLSHASCLVGVVHPSISLV